jgi:hypothetical protein
VVNPFDVLDRDCRDGDVLIERGPRPLEMADLIDRLGHDGRIRHARDPEYLAWRFQNPLHEYRFLFIDGPAGLEGYLVLQRRIEDIGRRPRIQIVDWEAASPKAGEALIRAAAGLGRDHHLVTWTATLPDEAVETLARAGFVPVDTESTARGYPSVLVRSLRDGYHETSWTIGSRQLTRLSDWDLRLIYSMSG